MIGNLSAFFLSLDSLSGERLYRAFLVDLDSPLVATMVIFSVDNKFSS